MSDSKLQSLGSVGSKAKHFLQESKEETSTASYIRRNVEATGVSRTTVFKIRKEQMDMGVLRPPNVQAGDLTLSLQFVIVVFPDHTHLLFLMRLLIRNKIQEFYTIRRQLPTLKSLHEVLKTDVDFPGSLNLLRKERLNIGYRWKRMKDDRKVLVEKPAIICQRLTFYNR